MADTIPSWVAVFVPLVMLALTVTVGELLASRRQHATVTDAVSTLLYFLFDGIQARALSWRLHRAAAAATAARALSWGLH